MSNYNRMVAIFALFALNTACATDEDLYASEAEMGIPSIETAFTANSEGFTDEVNHQLVVHAEITPIKMAFDTAVASESDSLEQTFELKPAPPRVLEPDAIEIDFERPIDGSRRFAFEPNGADEYIRNTEDHQEDFRAETMDKEIEDGQLWGDADEDNIDDKFDQDFEEDYDEREDEE